MRSAPRGAWCEQGGKGTGAPVASEAVEAAPGDQRARPGRTRTRVAGASAEAAAAGPGRAGRLRAGGGPAAECPHLRAPHLRAPHLRAPHPHPLAAMFIVNLSSLLFREDLKDVVRLHQPAQCSKCASGSCAYHSGERALPSTPTLRQRALPPASPTAAAKDGPAARRLPGTARLAPQSLVAEGAGPALGTHFTPRLPAAGADGDIAQLDGVLAAPGKLHAGLEVASLATGLHRPCTRPGCAYCSR